MRANIVKISDLTRANTNVGVYILYIYTYIIGTLGRLISSLGVIFLCHYTTHFLKSPLGKFLIAQILCGEK